MLLTNVDTLKMTPKKAKSGFKKGNRGRKEKKRK